MLKNVRLKLAFNRLQREMESFREDLTAEDLLNFAYSEIGSLITPWQYREEISKLTAEIKKLKPKNALEIGTANGGTLFLLCRLADPKAKIMSVDLPEGKFGGGYPAWKTKLYKKFALPKQELDLVRGDSHLPESFKIVRSHFDGAELDYLFIDGDHSYEGVKQDYEMYSPLVRKGGIIAFHDIVEHKSSDCKVDEFWREVKQGKESKEFVKDHDQGQYGIGILYN